jgi:hypothetical protein
LRIQLKNERCRQNFAALRPFDICIVADTNEKVKQKRAYIFNFSDKNYSSILKGN